MLAMHPETFEKLLKESLGSVGRSAVQKEVADQVFLPQNMLFGLAHVTIGGIEIGLGIGHPALQFPFREPSDSIARIGASARPWYHISEALTWNARDVVILECGEDI